MNTLTNKSSDYNALRDMVMNRPLADKLALVGELEKETFFERFTGLAERIRSRAEGNTFALDDIVEEVHEIRNTRYS